jgi:hypothetical protein
LGLRSGARGTMSPGTLTHRLSPSSRAFLAAKKTFSYFNAFFAAPFLSLPHAVRLDPWRLQVRLGLQLRTGAGLFGCLILRERMCYRWPKSRNQSPALTRRHALPLRGSKPRGQREREGRRSGYERRFWQCLYSRRGDPHKEGEGIIWSTPDDRCYIGLIFAPLRGLRHFVNVVGVYILWKPAPRVRSQPGGWVRERYGDACCGRSDGGDREI